MRCLIENPDLATGAVFAIAAYGAGSLISTMRAYLFARLETGFIGCRAKLPESEGSHNFAGRVNMCCVRFQQEFLTSGRHAAFLINVMFLLFQSPPGKPSIGAGMDLG